MNRKDEKLKELTAARFRAARESAGLSQGQVAQKLAMHRPTISEIEAGRRAVTSAELRKFATLFGVEIWWLSGADPEENQDAALARYEVAARALSKLKPQDFENVMALLSTLRNGRSEE